MFDDLPDDEFEPDDEIFEKFNLGDMEGDNKSLRDALSSMKETGNVDSSGIAIRRLLDLLGIFCNPLAILKPIATKSAAWIKDKFKSKELRKAEIRRINAGSTAIKKRADGNLEKDQAAAAIGNAIASAVRTESMMEMIEKLEEKGIQFQLDFSDDGRLIIVVTKLPKEEN